MLVEMPGIPVSYGSGSAYSSRASRRVSVVILLVRDLPSGHWILMNLPVGESHDTAVPITNCLLCSRPHRPQIISASPV